MKSIKIISQSKSRFFYFLLFMGLTSGSAWAKVSFINLEQNAVVAEKVTKMLTQENSGPTQFEVVRTIVDKEGNKHVRYNQTFNGVPVWGQQIITHDRLRTKEKLITGKYAENLDQENLALTESFTKLSQFNEKEALSIAKAYYIKNAKIDGPVSYENESSQKFVKLAEGSAKLIYEVSFFAEPKNGEPARPYYLIDVANKKVFEQWAGLSHADEEDAIGPGGNAKTGKYFYGTDYDFMKVTKNNNKCRLENKYVKTVDLNNCSWACWGKDVREFECPENLHKEINGAFSPLNDAHFFGTNVYRMYNDWIGVSPLGKKLELRVHYKSGYENAFWDGSKMTFGDGKNVFYPLVDINVVSHEVTHGFTEFNSGLAYRGESGGMNEAFSDMAGEAAEFYMFKKVDWLVGAGITKQADKALRYFAEPEKDGKSIGHANKYTSGLDVHYSSGVYNRAFYLLATTAGWDVQKAFEVFTLANQNYWTSNSSFNDGSCGVISASKDKAYNEADVVAAFAQVGVKCATL